MPRRKLSDAERWQTIGMIKAGMAYRVGEYLDFSHTVILCSVALKKNWRCGREEKNWRTQKDYREGRQTSEKTS
jgi:hypothetical protein